MTLGNNTIYIIFLFNFFTIILLLLYIFSILGRHGSVSLCRDERENKMAATYNVLAFKR